MTLLLIGVSGPAEAAIALDHGADIIDVMAASVGMPTESADRDSLRATVRAVAGRRPVSAAVPRDADDPLAEAAAMADSGVDEVRIALAPDGLATWAALASRVRLVAVLFADCAPDFSTLPRLAAAGFQSAMLDIADETGGRLLDHLPIADLARFVAAAQAAGLRAGLAGGLEAPDVPRLLVLRPDVLGFRRSRFIGHPDGALDAGAIGLLRALIARDDSAPPVTADHWLRPARALPAEQEVGPTLTDRVFVADLVLPVRIGAYAFEHEAPQRVRFDVEALVARTLRAARDMSDVFSYDLIVDGIRLLVDGGHHALVESLAERIAAVVLAHPRVMQVTVRVTKLDVGSGAMGVQIERRKPAGQQASILQIVGQPAAEILPLAMRARGEGGR